MNNEEIVIHGFASNTMKPCPFCSSTKLEAIRFMKTHWFHCVTCRNCGAEGPHIKAHGSFDESAKTACEDWNTR
jgi:Lar family restriction alleviation protein